MAAIAMFNCVTTFYYTPINAIYLPVFFTDADLVFFFKAAIVASGTLAPCPVIHLPLCPRIWTLIVFLAISRHRGRPLLYIRKNWSTTGHSDKEKTRWRSFSPLEQMPCLRIPGSLLWRWKATPLSVLRMKNLWLRHASLCV